MEKTLGERRVNVSFNPSENVDVTSIKSKTAELIDFLEDMRGKETSSEKHRLISMAQTEYEKAAMLAVKAVFADSE